MWFKWAELPLPHTAVGGGTWLSFFLCCFFVLLLISERLKECFPFGCMVLESYCVRQGEWSLPSQTAGGGAGLHRELQKLLTDVPSLSSNKQKMDAKQTFSIFFPSLLRVTMFTSFHQVA